jgi:glycolate oxidase FAD binding subunit
MYRIRWKSLAKLNIFEQPKRYLYESTVSMIQRNPDDLLIAGELSALIGAENVQLLSGEISVAPADTAEVSSVLQYANRIDLAVTPFGGGTKQSWGNETRPRLLLEMKRMAGVREHVWHDMTCTVGAGTRWSDMQSVLAEHGQFVALDPLWPGTATVGGVIAVNDSGTLRLKYGSLRDLIIGMTIVLSDGTIAKSGGKVVKNVAGYDLHKLMIGAFGTLGVVTEVTFRLHALPHEARVVTFASSNARPLGDLLLHIADTHLSVQRMQLRSGDNEFHLDVSLSALPECLSMQSAEIIEIAAVRKLRVQNISADVWMAREAEMEKTGINRTIIKCTMLPSNVSLFAELVHDMGGRSVTQAGGIMIASFENFSENVVGELRLEIEKGGGSLTIIKQPASANLPVWGAERESLPLMREIKRHFDPKQILNSGRFFGGI